MERVLTVVEGELLLLAVDGTEHPLEKYRPFRFPGGAASSSALPTGDIRNLNVIAREGAFKAYTSIVELSKKRAHPVFEGQLGILLQGQATVSPGNTGSLGSAESGSGGQDSPPPWHSAATTQWWARTAQRRKSWVVGSWPWCPSIR
jgi:environmental stress-induced protein Ves